MAASLRQFFGRFLALAARPVGTAQGQSGIALLPYRGYGSTREIFLIGRVFKRSNEALADRWKGMPGQLRNVLRRITSGAVASAEITASFSGAVQRVNTDADGYFRVHLHLTAAPNTGQAWHRPHDDGSTDIGTRICVHPTCKLPLRRNQ